MKSHKLRSIIKWLVKRLTRTSYLGVENIPVSGGVLIAAILYCLFLVRILGQDMQQITRHWLPAV